MFLLFGMILLPFFGFAQVSKQQAINSVLNSVVGCDVGEVNVYMEPLSKSDSYYKMSRYDSIRAPYANYWLFFIDDMPEYGWGHDCRYVFVNSENGSIFIRNSQMPPWHFKMKLETILEPISVLFPLYDISSNHYKDTNTIAKPVDGKFAVLFTGGEIRNDTLTPFWNALSHSYCGLVEHGFPKENIFVLSADGGNGNSGCNPMLDLDNNGEDDILNAPCCVDSLRWIFDSLSHIMKEGDLLYVFGVMHGFIEDTISYVTYLGMWNNEHLYDSTFANMLSKIKCSQCIVNLWACHSGGMADNIININNGTKMTVLTCIDKRNSIIRINPFVNHTGMDVYNYFINTAFRTYHPCYDTAFWHRKCKIGQLFDPSVFGNYLMDFDFDNSNMGNKN